MNFDLSMKCEICGDKTRINWGNSGHILCENHFDERTNFKHTAINKNSAYHENNLIEISKSNKWWAILWLGVITPGIGSLIFMLQTKNRIE